MVYRARRGSTDCALKVPRVRGQWTRWVYREAVALARIHHPGLPRVLEVGEAEGLPYLLMELVEGETLAQKLRHGPLTPDLTLDIGCQLADTLRAAHEVGLVHRDVKPRNIILENAGRVRLVDLGFATPAGTSAAHDEAGTRRYSAPEQFLATGRVDGRADLYALGRVLSECLIGALGPETQSAMVVELTSAGIPTTIARIVGGLVAESPSDRYPDALAVLAELHRARAGGAPRGPAAFEPARLQPPLVGRDVELERFTKSWRDVEASGGGVVLVEGMSGAGKTRFLRACTARVRDEGRGRSLESVCREGDPPLGSLRRMFESHFASLRRLAPQERAAALTALRAAATGSLSSLAMAIAPEFGEILEAEPTAQAAVPDAFAEGAAELVVRLARGAGPLVLCFDDVQWLDAMSREVFLAIADRSHEAPLLLLAATRPTLDSALGTLEPRRSVKISLGPLELRQSAALVASHLGVATVDAPVLRRITSMSDASPVGVLEVLGALLDAGALRLRDNVWELHADSADRIRLPAGSLTYLGRRVADLPPATRRVLEVAALLGTNFEDTLLARVVGLDASDAEFALADGRRAGLLEPEDGGRHRFGHDSLREQLAASLDEVAKRRWHQKAAEVLAELRQPTADQIYACALHFAAGEVDKLPGPACHAARRAAEVAIDRFDDEAALRFFDNARGLAGSARLRLDAAFHRKVGEANLRIGSLDESLRSFQTALEVMDDPVGRASILGRVAWVQRARSEPEEALAALGQAFEELGDHIPLGKDEPPSVGSHAQGTNVHSAEALDVLYDLHQQNARLGAECGMPRRTLQSATQIAALAADRGPSAALARAHATCGALLSAMGHRAEGNRRLAKAHEMATKLGDPATMAFCLPRRVVALAFAGQFDPALALCRRCTDEYGPWLEMAELCDIVNNGDIVESVRGRATEAWGWCAHATDRLRRRQRTSAVFTTYIPHRTRAALASLGPEAQMGPWLRAQLEAVNATGERARYRMISWGARARYLLDTGQLGAPFDDLVRDFESQNLSPQSAHLILVEYYIVVAQARVHQCLRASPEERPVRVGSLRKAASDLRAAAKLPLLVAHANFVDASLAWFDGDHAKARRLLAKAETLAASETCPWVSWGVARVRAHMLRERGKLDAALDQARIAEVLARSHGAEPRARWVREEFLLPAPEAMGPASSMASSSRRSSRHARRQLASLLHLLSAPHGHLQPEQQAVAILDDLVRELVADRAYLRFEPTDDARGRLAVGRSRLGEPLAVPEGWRDDLMRSVRDAGDEPPISQERPMGQGAGSGDRSRVIAVPLFLNERVVGSLLVERAASEPAFAPDDHELLLILSHQVPLGLELPRLLTEREQIQASVQQAQKMEVVGQLAGSVAHDFNNMLSVIVAAVDELLLNETLNDEAKLDAAALSGAAQRATRLTKRLLAFSRNQTLALGPVDVNRLLTGIQPLLERVTNPSSKIHLVLDLSPSAQHAFSDEGSLDQAVMNLAVNARDAMPDGGTVRISTRAVSLGAEAVRRGAPAEGDYVEIEVADSGQGMTPEVISRVFDPFFTTKPAGKGTGLGLTSVYAFVKQCGGHIELSSEVGRGTTFRLYFRKAESIHVERRPSSPAPEVTRAASPAVILVVDDDPNVRAVTSALLQQGGYKVLAASGSSDAMRLAQMRGAEIALIILDVQMPEMSGPELGRRLADLHLPAKVLFVSGAMPEEDGSEEQPLLLKPFSSDALLGRVRRMLDS